MVRSSRCRSAASRDFRRLLTSVCCLTALTTLAYGANARGTVDLNQRVADHLAAGEFGPALTLAAASTDPAEKARLLEDVAVAQQVAGEFDAAAGTRRRIPASQKQGLNSPQTAPVGGGGMQGMMMLMRLIQQSTPGKWQNEDGEGGSMSPFMTGVKVSPDGLLQRLTTEEQAGQLRSLGIQARKADLNQELSKKSNLRMVSLARLEQAVARRLDEGLPVPESMAQFAGLYQVKYVFIYPEVNDIVLAGPADGWQYDAKGQPVSLSGGHPTLQLDDFVTVLRTFARGETSFGCSINTRDEGVKALKEYVEKSASRGGISDKATKGWVNQLQKKLGRQDVVIWGVPADSRVARVIVEADYRMKLIGIDKLDAGKEIPSYFDLLPMSQQKDPPPMDALRWWLTMKFDAVSHSADKSAFEIQGSSVLCQSENQLLTDEGKHLPTGQSEATNRLFAENFTNNYGKLSARDLVFADTQNVFDLALCAALIKNEHLLDKSGWNMGTFAPHGAFTTATYPVPREIDSVVNHRVYRDHQIVVQVAGGVTANVMAAAKDPKLNRQTPELAGVGQTAKAPQLPVGRWWWDVAN